MKDYRNSFSTRIFGIFAVNFVGIFFSFAINSFELAILFSAIAGLLFALVLRNRDARPAEEMPTLSIVIMDYRFRNFSAIGFLSILYAILQGVLLGVASGSFTYALRCAISFDFDPRSVIFFISYGHWLFATLFCLLLSLLSLIMVGVCRVFTETYILVFKVSQKYLSS